MRKNITEDWQAEGDAYILLQYGELAKDSKRMRKAQKAAEAKASKLKSESDKYKKLSCGGKLKKK